MILRATPSVAPRRITTLSLEDGADSEACLENPVEISDRGLQIRSRWQFEIGTQLSISFVCERMGRPKRHWTTEGTVVWCEPSGTSPQTYQSTLLFLELPDELKDDLRELSYLLTAQG